MSLDLDAASAVSLYMLQKNITIDNVVFVSADFDGKGMAEEDIAIDIFVEGKGIKGNPSAFSSILHIIDKKYKKPFAELSKFIDAHDYTGNWKTAYVVDDNENIPTILETFRWLRRTNDDEALLTIWFLVIKGIWLSYLDFIKAQKYADNAKWEKSVAIIEGKCPLQTSSILFKNGASFVVYNDGNNIGVMRSPDNEINLGEHLKKWFPDWFHHPNGILSCWGSVKSPKEFPYGISATYVAEIVSTLLNK